jgi:hypothetical protein
MFKLYAVQSQDGKWFRSKGYGGHGSSWVSDINKAKLYSKLQQAKGRVTWWYNNYPEFGVPQIVVFEAKQTEIIIDEERQKKIQHERKLAAKKHAVQKHKRMIKDATERLKKAQKDLEGLGEHV